MDEVPSLTVVQHFPESSATISFSHEQSGQMSAVHWCFVGAEGISKASPASSAGNVVLAALPTNQVYQACREGTCHDLPLPRWAHLLILSTSTVSEEYFPVLNMGYDLSRLQLLAQAQATDS